MWVIYFNYNVWSNRIKNFVNDDFKSFRIAEFEHRRNAAPRAIIVCDYLLLHFHVSTILMFLGVFGYLHCLCNVEQWMFSYESITQQVSSPSGLTPMWTRIRCIYVTVSVSELKCLSVLDLDITISFANRFEMRLSISHGMHWTKAIVSHFHAWANLSGHHVNARQNIEFRYSSG